MFILPFIITFAVFFVAPLIQTTVMSFQNVVPGKTTFVGIDNYTSLFADEIFWKSVVNSLLYMALTLLLLIPIPMLLATFINSKKLLGTGFFKSVFFLPALTSVVVAGTIFRLMYGELDGSLMNQIVMLFGGEPIKWLRGTQDTGYFALLMLACWRWMGVNILYYLAGLNNISPDLYEAAEIDGASGWQKFTKITIPMLKSTTVYVLTISIYGGLAMFAESYMLWNGNISPQNMGLTIVGYLYRQGIEKNRMGFASAVGLVLLVIVMVINVVQLKASGTFKRKGR